MLFKRLKNMASSLSIRKHQNEDKTVRLEMIDNILNPKCKKYRVAHTMGYSATKVGVKCHAVHDKKRYGTYT